MRGLVIRKLILTSDERTWPEDKKDPVIFLGEWCRLYNRKENWEKLDAEIQTYHWDDREKFLKDNKYLKVLYEKLLSDLSKKLNYIHSVNNKPRYWRILIGPWLGFFVQILFDRWFMLKKTIDEKKISSCKIIKRDPISIIPNDSKHFRKLFQTDDWNEAIYGQLLDSFWGDAINIEKIKVESLAEVSPNNQTEATKVSFKNRVEHYLTILFNKLFIKKDDYFFITSYLRIKILLKLQISLRQFPKLWKFIPSPITKPDINQRKWELEGHELTADTFEKLIRHFIPFHIPTCYLEGYEKLKKTISQNGWPEKPKAIFTSNSFTADDVFTIWAAEKTQEENSKLVIGQHGGIFGMTPFGFLEEHQIEISDKWLSWGWTDKNRPKIKPFCNFKNHGRKPMYDPNGVALMVGMCMSRYSHHLRSIPVASQWLYYFDDQQKFINALPDELRKKVIVKLQPQDFGWNQKKRWRDKIPEVQIEAENKYIEKLISKSRIYISTYNATTYLESLYWNIPSIIFWDPKYWELKEEVKPYFESLKSVGIFHETPESAARHLIEIWDKIDIWWKSKEVQNAREIFCDKYSKKSKDLKTLLFHLK